MTNVEIQAIQTLNLSVAAMALLPMLLTLWTCLTSKVTIGDRGQQE